MKKINSSLKWFTLRNALPHRASTGGFTLVELMVVVSIILILILLGYPSMQYVLRESRRAGCLTAISRLSVPAAAYQADHHGYLPPRAADTDPARSFMYYFQPYLAPDTVFLCPEAKEPDWSSSATAGGVNRPWYFRTSTFKDYSSYGLSYSHSGSVDGGPSPRSITFKTPAYALPDSAPANDTPMFVDCTWPGFKPDDDWAARIPVTRHGGGVNILFADGSARFVQSDQVRYLIWGINYVPPSP